MTKVNARPDGGGIRGTRREFIKAGAALAAILPLASGRTLAGAYGANDRIGVGFIGCGGRPKDSPFGKETTFPIEKGSDQLRYWEEFLACCRERKRQTASPADLAYYTHRRRCTWP